MASHLAVQYKEEVASALIEKFGYKSIIQTPKIERIVLNMGIGDAVSNARSLDEAVEELTLTSGQKPLITKAKESIASFRLRESMSIGAGVTLRGDRMYDFLDKLVNVSLLRVRDFRGISTRSSDGRDDYTLGTKEQLIFPEINFDKVDHTRGLDVAIVTTAQTDEEVREFLRQFGFPFAK